MQQFLWQVPSFFELAEGSAVIDSEDGEASTLSGVCCIKPEGNDEKQQYGVLFDTTLPGVSEDKRFHTVFHLVPDTEPLQLQRGSTLLNLDTLSSISTTTYVNLDKANGELRIPVIDITDPLTGEIHAYSAELKTINDDLTQFELVNFKALSYQNNSSDSFK